MARLATGGGRFRKDDNWVYFLAADAHSLEVAHVVHGDILVAVNELESTSKIGAFETILEGEGGPPPRVLLDSGVYALAMEHVVRHGVSHDVGLSMPPDEIDGFTDLFERYVSLVQTYADRLWGYVEIDLGGKENKRKTRARLEAMGLRPIPVYHPFLDGWDYFDELAERYDRICFGNIVQADRYERARLIATAWERHRDYPDLWIHLLGYTPNELLCAFPVNSGDSSSWLASVRWSGYIERANLRTFGHLPKGFQYDLGDTRPESRRSHFKGLRMSAYGSGMAQRNWRAYLKRLEDFGATVYPEVVE